MQIDIFRFYMCSVLQITVDWNAEPASQQDWPMGFAEGAFLQWYVEGASFVLKTIKITDDPGSKPNLICLEMRHKAWQS